MIWYLISKIGE